MSCIVSLVKTLTRTQSNIKGHALFRGEIITKTKKLSRNLKIFFRTTGPISIKLGKNHPRVKGV